MARKKTSTNKIQVGDIREVSGELTIAGGDIYKGYTARQVSVLLKQITTTFQPRKFDGNCPYKGLESFEEEDAGLFFGREQWIDKLVSHVQTSRTLFVIGASGSGKSSLLRAGLLHALKQGAIKNRHSERWVYETLNPGHDPIEALALALSRAKSPELGNYLRQHAEQAKSLYECAETILTSRKDQRFVLFIDQFEEVFTQVSDNQKRLTFLNLLAHAATIDNGRLILLFAMRSDFVSNLAIYPQLNALFNQQSVQIGAMRPDELVSAIAQPALRVGLRVDPNLIAQIINDMQGEPGALPLMQFALKDLFDTEQATGKLTALRLDDYLQRGGIHKSLERHADTVFAELNTREQELARSIFGRLIEIGQGTQDTRRIAKFEELVPADTQVADIQTLVQKLTDARLITTAETAGQYTATISHEKLIDAWPWLKKLVTDNRETIALQNDIANDAREWDENHRDPSYLYTGARLMSAREQLIAKKLVLNSLAREFVKAGNAKQRSGRIAWITGLSTVILLLVLAVIVFSSQSRENAALADQNAKIASSAQAASTEAVSQRETAQANAEEAQKQTRIVIARQLAEKAQSLLDAGGPNQQTAVLLAIESLQFAPIDTAVKILANNKLAKPVSQLVHAEPVESAIFSPDNQYVGTTSIDHLARVWDLETGREVSQMTHDDKVYSLAFSPDGKNVVSASADGRVRVWDSTTGKQISQVDYGSAAYQAEFYNNGEYIVSDGCDQKDPAEDTCILASIRVWQAKSGNEVQRIAYDATIGSFVLSADGESAAIGECVQKNEGGFCTHGLARILDMQTGSEISRVFTTGGFDAFAAFAFSPNGMYIISTGCGQFDQGNECTQGLAQLWETETGQEISAMDFGTWVNSFDFSIDSKYIVIGSFDGTASVWEVATGEKIDTIAEGAYINSVAFSSDGQYAASGGCLERQGFLRFACAVGFAQLWDLTTHAELATVTYGSEIYSVRFSPNDEYVFWEGGDGTDVWQMTTNQELVYLPGNAGVDISPNGEYILSTTDNIVRVLSANTGSEIVQMTQADRTMISLSADGHYAAFGGCPPDYSDSDCIGGNLQVREVATGKQIATVTAVGKTRAIAFSPDNNYLALGGCDRLDAHGLCVQGSARVMELMTDTEISRMLHNGEVTAVAFSPDGKLVASGGCDQTNSGGYFCKQGSVRVWEAATGKEITHITEEDEVTAITFSPDGIHVAFIGRYDFQDAVVVLEAATGKEISRIACYCRSVMFNPDGKYVLGLGDEQADIWNALTGEKVVSMYHGQLGPSSPVTSASFSTDGKYVISGGGDGMASLWELATGQWMFSRSQSSRSDGSMISVAFSPDGKYLVSGNSEGIIQIWDSALANEVAQMTQPDSVNSVRFSADSRYIISTSDTQVRLWGVRPDDLIAEACTRVTSNLTHADWLQYFGDTLPFQAVCPYIPLNFDYIETIVWDTLSKSEDPTRITTALEQVEAELREVETQTNLKSEALRILSPSLLEQIETEVSSKVTANTRSFLDQAGKIKITITMQDQDVLQGICRKGSLNGYGTQILPYCDFAIQLSPRNVKSYDYRGIARAVSGDYAGAIFDFQYFVDHSRSPDLIEQRQQWIKMLQANNNPFSPEVLAILKQPPVTSTSMAASPTPTYTQPPAQFTPTPWITPTAVFSVLPCSTGTVTLSNGLININTASVCELETLPGIGPTAAQNIVNYREQNGPFLTKEDILNVVGIGPAAFDLIKDLITTSE